MPTSPPPRIRRQALGALVAVLLVCAAGFLAVGARAGGDPAAGPVSVPAAAGTEVAGPTDATPPTLIATPTAAPPPTSAAATPVPDVEPARSPPGAVTAPTGAVPQPSRPVSLGIPSIGVAESTLSVLGLNPDETVEVPTDFDRAGWFGLGPTPGESGAAVILGHVDSTTGPAVFFRLRSLTPGDRVEVGLADGRMARFVVDSVETYPKDRFPARRVYTSNGTRDLQLVTCGGEFDRASGHYLSNVVAFTSFVEMIPA